MKKALVMLLLLTLIFSLSDAGGKFFVQNIRHSSSGNHVRIVVDVDGPLTYTSHRLSNPDRLYFDLKDFTLSEGIQTSLTLDNGLIKKVRTSQFDRKTVRVVLDIIRLDRFTAFILDNPHRLVIDAYSENAMSFRKQVRADSMKALGIGRIVIDPGHGGKDPGAIGPRGLQEKDVVLDIARRLGEIIREENGLEVIYTRDSDRFIPLDERTDIANENAADLFISIHVNASKRRSARGVETYFLNWTNDAEASRVAARENSISVRKIQQVQGELRMILLDLARDVKNDQSMKLASSIQEAIVSNLQKSYNKVENNKVKWAPFYVLIGAEMPSVLIETSFISNREEEMRLSTVKYRTMIAEAIAKGVNDYIRRSSFIVQSVGETS